MAKNNFSKVLKALHSNKKKQWTKQQKEFLKKYASSLSDEEMATKLGKTKKAIKEMRARLGLKKHGGRGITDLEKDYNNNDE